MPKEVDSKWAYFEGKIVPFDQARVSVATHAFNYGTGTFEGIRAYWNEEEKQLFVFKMREHYERFLRNARFFLMEPTLTAEELGEITLTLLRKEDFRGNAYIRPIAYKSGRMIGVRLRGIPSEVTIFCTSFGRYVQNEEGASACISSWRKVPDASIPYSTKPMGVYVNAALHKDDAEKDNYDEAIVLDISGFVTEGSAENFFMVRNGVVITPSLGQDIFEGITRNFIIELCRNDLGIAVEERLISRREVHFADEIFLAGTGAQIVAVTSCQRRTIGTGKMGPVTKAIRDLYFEIVRGRNKKYRHLCTPVYEK